MTRPPRHRCWEIDRRRGCRACLVRRLGPLRPRAIQHDQAGSGDRLRASTPQRQGKAGVCVGLTGPSQTARQPGTGLSAANDAELGQRVSVVKSGHGYSPEGAARLKLWGGKRRRQRHPVRLRRQVDPTGRPVTRHPHVAERLLIRRCRARRNAMFQTADGLGGSVTLHRAGMRLDTLGRMSPRRRLRQCRRGELWTQ